MSGQVYVFGEGMLELASANTAPRLGYGGDAFNTAVYLARLGAPVEFVTALGEDRFSQQARSDWRTLGLSLTHCLTSPRRVMGLYAIHVDASGERSFTYWRDQSAARAFYALDGAAEAEAAMRGAPALYFSLISLSILDRAARARLISTARAVRARGGVVAFDTNYRPQGWSEVALARETLLSVMPHVTMALPSRADHAALFGRESMKSCAERWRANGAHEVVVKDGQNGCLLLAGAAAPCFVPARIVRATDTTGAGDSFNAAYIAGRLNGRSSPDACSDAQEFAARVVQHHGAIIP